MRTLSAALLLVFLMSGAAQAQSVPFGDDQSRWANDGECDDPRFEGAGMTQTPLLDDDIKHDATDCKAAFDAGTIALRGQGTATAAAAEPDMIVDGINYGTDQGEFPNDGECDDRRFFGAGMAQDISWSNVGRDATDCSAGVSAGSIRLWEFAAAQAATECSSLDFGGDTGEYPNDMECDDQRFEGPASAMNLTTANIGGDASDCRALCTYGTVFLRDYP